jgi:hypothetical protein
LGTNIYQSKDGRWYCLHGSMDPTALLEMLQIPQHNEQNLGWKEIIQMYSKVVGEIESVTLDNWSNNVYRTPGTICFEEDHFKTTPQWRAIKDEPYYNLIPQTFYKQPPVSWDTVPFDPLDRRPLSGIKVLELARAIAGPTIGKMCASLGATVIRVSCSKNTELPITLMDGCLGKISIDIDLKTFDGRKKLLDLVQEADVFIDGYRPAVLEHLGFGRDAILGLVANRNRGIVYCQENCYGWKGPWMTRPGWAQIADTVSSRLLLRTYDSEQLIKCLLRYAGLAMILAASTASTNLTSFLAPTSITCKCFFFIDRRTRGAWQRIELTESQDRTCRRCRHITRALHPSTPRRLLRRAMLSARF